VNPSAKFALKLWASIYAVVAVFAILGKLLGTAALPLEDAVGKLLNEPVEIAGIRYGVGTPITPNMVAFLAEKNMEEIRTRRPGILGFRHYGAAMAFLNFLGLVLLIYAVAWDKLIAALGDKIESVKNELATAESRKKESLELLRTYEDLLHKLRDERQSMLSAAEADGKTAYEGMSAAAKETAGVIVEAAKRESQAREEHGLWELRKDVAVKAVELAEQVLRKEATEKDHDFMVRDFMEKLREMKLA